MNLLSEESQIASFLPNLSQLVSFCETSKRSHESEVTDMLFVNCSSSGKDVQILFSACCAGKVYFYPNALDPDQNSSTK